MRFASFQGTQTYSISFQVNAPTVTELTDVTEYIRKELCEADDVCYSTRLDQNWSTGETLKPGVEYYQLIELSHLFVRGETYNYSEHKITGDYKIHWDESSNVLQENTASLVYSLNHYFAPKYNITKIMAYAPELPEGADVIRRV